MSSRSSSLPRASALPGVGRGLLVVGDSQAASQVQVANADALRGEAHDEVLQPFQGVHEGADPGQLAPDVARDAAHVQVGVPCRSNVLLEGPVHGNAELILLHAGGDVGVGLGIDIRVDPNGQGGTGACGARHLVEARNLLGRFGRKEQDAGAKGVVHLLPGLAHARVDDLSGVHAGGQGAKELPAAHDVHAGALIGEKPQNRHAGVGLHGVAHLVGNRLKGPVNGPVMLHQGGVRVEIERRSHLRGDPGDRDVLCVHLFISVLKMVHDPLTPSLDDERPCMSRRARHEGFDSTGLRAFPNRAPLRGPQPPPGPGWMQDPARRPGRSRGP